MAVFLVASALLALLVLAPVLAPFLRARPAQGVALSAVALLGAVLLYRLVGTPAALDPAKRRAPDSLAAAISRLEEELSRDPSQAEGWRLLADGYRATGRMQDAARALGRAASLTPGNADLLAQAAEARAAARPDRRFDDEAVAMLQRALAAEPRHERSRWFLGVAQRQAGRPAEAAHTWEALLPLVAPSTVKALRPQIDAARRDAGLPPLAPARALLTLEVDIDPALRGAFPPTAAVFVLAREAGTPMPVAARRLTLADLPATVELGDDDSPMPTRRLSQLQRVEVIARVSATGVANAGAGDAESEAVPLETGGSTSLRIDRRR